MLDQQTRHVIHICPQQKTIEHQAYAVCAAICIRFHTQNSLFIITITIIIYWIFRMANNNNNFPWRTQNGFANIWRFEGFECFACVILAKLEMSSRIKFLFDVCFESLSCTCMVWWLLIDSHLIIDESMLTSMNIYFYHSDNQSSTGLHKIEAYTQ